MNKILNKWIFLLLLNSALLQASIYVIRPMITYRGLELNASVSTIGILGAFYALLPVLLAVTFGRSVNKLGEKRFLVLGGFGILISSLLLKNTNSIFWLAVLTAAAGIAHLAVMVGGQTLVSKKSPSASYDKYFGYYTFSASLGQMVGPLLGGYVAGSNGSLPKSTANAFVLAAVLALIGLVPMIFAKTDKTNQKSELNSEVAKVKVSDLLQNKGISSAIFTSLIISSSSDILVVFLPLFGQEKNFSPTAVGLLLSLRAGMAMASRFFLGNLTMRFTARNVMVLSGLVSAGSCGLMFVGNTVITMGLIIAIAGFALGIGQPLTMAWVSRCSNINERPMVISLRLTGNRLGQFTLPLIAGLTASSLGTGAVFLVLSGMLGISTVVCNKNFHSS